MICDIYLFNSLNMIIKSDQILTQVSVSTSSDMLW